MKNEPIIKPLRLVFQGSVTVENAEDADIFYDTLKTLVKERGVESTLNGQVIKMLEPCCKEKNKTSPIAAVMAAGGQTNVGNT